MTNPKVKEAPYSYLIDPADKTGKGPKPSLKRLLIDEPSVPSGFRLQIPNMPIELVDRSKRMPEMGEMDIIVYRFVPKWDGSIEIKFLHGGYGLIKPLASQLFGQEREWQVVRQVFGRIQPMICPAPLWLGT